MNDLEPLPSLLDASPFEFNNGKGIGQHLRDGRKSGVVKEVIPNGDIIISTYENDELNGLCIKWSANTPCFSA